MPYSAFINFRLLYVCRCVDLAIRVSGRGGRYGFDSEMESLRRSYVQSLNEGFARPSTPRRHFMSSTVHQQLLQEAASRETHPAEPQQPLVGEIGRSRQPSSNSDRSPRKRRFRRAADYFNRRRRKKLCNRSELYVDFREIGWSGWIISPKGYNAYHCTGECPFPLGQDQRPTNHATVQSIVHALKKDSHLSTPCCVPDKLYSISLLYFDEEENVILKQYDEMVAASCGCH